MINAALTRPTDLGLPFACWTLDRLVAWLSQQGMQPDQRDLHPGGPQMAA